MLYQGGESIRPAFLGSPVLAELLLPHMGPEWETNEPGLAQWVWPIIIEKGNQSRWGS